MLRYGIFTTVYCWYSNLVTVTMFNSSFLFNDCDIKESEFKIQSRYYVPVINNL